MVRLAMVNDAAQLKALNEEFNGKGEATVESIEKSLTGNKRELVMIDEENGQITGFLCIQLKKSFCYIEYLPEITEVYVRQACRRKGIAKAMITFAEELLQNYPVFECGLLTGEDNAAAQAVYHSLGYQIDGELHFSKKLRP